MYYWKCEECDESNPYPEIKFCETCGTPMSAAAEKAVLDEMAADVRKREEDKQQRQAAFQEEQRKRREADARMTAEIQAAKKADENRRLEAEKNRLCRNREIQLTKRIAILMRLLVALKIVMLSLVGVAVAASVAMILINLDTLTPENIPQTLSENTIREIYAHTDAVTVGECDMLPSVNDALTFADNDCIPKRIYFISEYSLDNIRLMPSSVKNAYSVAIGLAGKFRPVENVSEFVDGLGKMLSEVG